LSDHHLATAHSFELSQAGRILGWPQLNIHCFYIQFGGPASEDDRRRSLPQSQTPTHDHRRMTMKQFLLATALTVASINAAWPQASADHQGLHPPEASAPAPQTAPTPDQPQQSPGATTGSPTMQGMMKGMMQTMHGMMGMMHGQAQPGQMQPGQMQPGQMQPGQMQSGPMQHGRMQQPGSRPPHAQGGMMMNCPMMSAGAQGPSPAMMQMMQGMMQMMQAMHSHIQQSQTPPSGK
jgi:hypothetical protein